MRLTMSCVVLVIMCASGCRSTQARLPEFQGLETTAAIKLLRQRGRAIENASAEALVVLTHQDGRSIRLDAAIVMQPPDLVRLRAWKFGRAVFDLTLTPDGTWLSAEAGDQAEQLRSAAANASDFARQWSLLTGRFFDKPDLELVSDSFSSLRIRRPARAGEPVIVCDVDRPTLTPRRFAVIDEAGRPRFTLHLDRYELIGNIPWAQRVRAVSEQGRVTIESRAVELNRELSPNAFRPPRRAEKLP
jgi:hypothetical protein